jgi:uncharacterized membrane protein
MQKKREHVSNILREKYAAVEMDEDDVQINTDEVVYDAIE